ncbi:hypothetical protein D5F11_021465 [Siminovitchia terrae]|uniref:Uncharacterized protein n=1 Tax=Siminovitchia terrae TaxID=1914933 RepID=A0A429X2G2_SIMTE|nr:hypothetical protein [Siminovitchia terrae]RST57632.1 hypothetical protein D5F11_021465 [Siminovitchia terrae]
MQSAIDELNQNLLAETIKEMCQQAYEQGVEDARNKYAYPPTLKKTHLTEIFQVAMPTVDNIIRMEGFPRSTITKARYPRDQVFEWIKDNIEYVRYNTNYLKGIS